MEGKIVLIKVFFTDLSEFKIRPVLILKKYEKFDYMFLPITSNLNKKWIRINKEDLSEWNLEKESVILIPKFGIINKNLILKELAKVNLETFLKIWKKICEEFGCDLIL